MSRWEIDLHYDRRFLDSDRRYLEVERAVGAFGFHLSLVGRRGRGLPQALSASLPPG